MMFCQPDGTSVHGLQADEITYFQLHNYTGGFWTIISLVADGCLHHRYGFFIDSKLHSVMVDWRSVWIIFKKNLGKDMVDSLTLHHQLTVLLGEVVDWIKI